MRKQAWIAAFVFLGALAPFWPVLRNGFVNFDDDVNFVRNPMIRSLSEENVKWMFDPAVIPQYYPLTWLSVAADASLWGEGPAAIHRTSLLIHALSAVLLFLIARELLLLGMAASPGASSAGAAFAALFFAVHPLRVESVAWATERSDVLCGFFFLAAILLYLRYARTRGAKAYAGTLLLFILALLSKALAVVLPLTLLLLDAYPLRRLSWKIAAEKIPFFFLAALSALLAVHGQSRGLAPWPWETFGLAPRLALEAYGFAFYALKTLAPFHLLPLYPMPKSVSFSDWPFAASAVAVAAAIFAAAAAWKKGRPAWLLVWIFYAAALFPVSGIVKTGPQLAADRYSYLPSMGLAVLAGAGFAALWSRARRAALIEGALVIAALSILTWRQTWVWRDSETFWSWMVAEDAHHAIARNYLAQIRLENGDAAAAESLMRAAISIDPDYGAAHNNLANLLLNTGRFDEAVEHYRAAIIAAPEHPIAHFNLGLALERTGKISQALDAYEAELKIDPQSLPAKAALSRLSNFRQAPLVGSQRAQAR